MAIFRDSGIDGKTAIVTGGSRGIGREIVKALNGVGANVSFVEIETDQGHDSFLMDIADYHRVVRGFLEGAAELQGMPGP